MSRTVWHVTEIKDLVADLRKALGWTQEQVADRSGGALTRIVVNKIETGRNKASSAAVRDGLATAFGLERSAMFDYLDGAIGLEEAVALRSGGERVARYPNREAAIERNARRWTHATVLELRSIGLHSKKDLPVDEWAKKGNEIQSVGRGKATGHVGLDDENDAPPIAKRTRHRRT